ncbi:MAG: sensor histidine kinase [Planctomycetota bacterium]|jgi:two-component system NtrC family sensor kinase
MRSRSAALELTLLVVLVMAILLVSFTVLSLRWERTWLLQEVQRGLTLASDILLSSMRFGMMHRDQENIRQAIERVGRDTRIQRVRIIEHRGRVTLSTHEEEIETVVDRTSSTCTLCHLQGAESGQRNPLTPEARTLVEGQILHAFTPVLAEPGCITSECHTEDAGSKVLGVIDLSLSLEDMEEALSQNQRKLSVLSLAAVLLGGGLLWIALSRRLRRPLRDLLRGIRRVAKGDLDHHIPARARDEFGELAKSFNAMSRQLITVQQSLIQSERLISMGKLSAGVAHEINNPLTGILAYAEDLLEDAESSDPRRKDYEVIVHEALRCRQIVRNLLDFARQDAPAMTRVHPGAVIQRTLDVITRLPAFRNIRVTRCIEEKVPVIEADPVQIQQVLVNLVINAQQAMPQGGEIVLRVKVSGPPTHVEFSVEDEGPGIPREIQPRIFEPFFSTKEGKTDGLGLAVCLGIIQQHGGTIQLESDPEKGTTFRVRLPATRDRSPGKGGSE